MVRGKIHIVTLLLLLFFNIISEAQTVESLENKIQSIQKDIKLAEKLLKETSKNKETSINQINLLQTQIKQREELIKTYQNQLNVINREIKRNKDNISLLEKDLNLYRKEYSNLLLINYRNKGKVNNMMFILSSEDFNQAMRRIRYIQELNDLVKNKIKDIEATQVKINDNLERNEANKKEKENILQREKKEKDILIKEKDNLNKELTALKRKEKQIQKEINTKEKEAKDLKVKIEKIIAEEIRKAKEREEAAKKAKAEGSANTSKSIDYNLSNNFAQNKGKLPYPVSNGIITGKYGLSQHPTLKKVTTNNNGVDISTTKGSDARAVFDGEVCFITNQGSNNAILIRHGLYFTLYSNLDKVYVKVGEKVKTGQEIGRVHTNVSDGKTILHFEIWQENKTTVNPALWIRK